MSCMASFSSPMMRWLARWLVRAVAVFVALIICLMVTTPAAAHGGVTGAQDMIQDYGVLLFLVAVVLIGAGVLVWVMLSPPAEGEGTSAPPGEAKS